MGGCNGPVRSEACPNPMGPDLDIGNSPILKSAARDGKRALIVGTKQGHVIALDPDNKGAVLYRVLATTGQAVVDGRRPRRQYRVGRRGRRSECVLRCRRQRACGVAAGDRRKGMGVSHRREVAVLGAAPTAIPGVVFEGASNGRLFAVSTANGKRSGISIPRRNS